MVLNIKNFPDELHREIKIKSAVEGISMKDLIIKALQEYLKKKGGD
ncbi:3-hydroxyacyl-CoA dehydrogenase [Thermodesulfobacteriota bacterium]